MAQPDRPDRSEYLVRKSTLREQGEDTDLQTATPAERIGMVWQLTLDAWAFTGQRIAEPRLPRHIVRVYRRRG